MSIPILHYELNSPNLGEDSSGNGIDLTNTNVTLVTDNIRGPVADFNGGNARLESILNVPASVLGDKPRTYMLWAKNPSDLTGNFWLFGQGLSKYSSIGNWFMYLFGTSQEHVQLSIGKYSGSTPRHFGQIRVSYGEWNHFAVTYDGTAGTMIVNGVAATPVTVGIDTNPSPIRLGASRIYTSDPYYFEGQMSDFRVYDTALSVPEIVAASQNPVVYPTLLKRTPWSTLVETSWSSVDNATSYRLTIDSGSGESTVVDNTTSLGTVIYNLHPDTFYMLRLYYSMDGGTTYALEKEESITTLLDTSANSNIEIFSNNGIYDLSPLNDFTRSMLENHLSSTLTTGDSIVVNDTRLRKKTLTLVTPGSVSTIPSGNSMVLIPFNPDDGSSQSVNLELSDSSTVSINYDDISNTIDIGGITYSPGENFVLDGKKVIVYHI